MYYTQVIVCNESNDYTMYCESQLPSSNLPSGCVQANALVLHVCLSIHLLCLSLWCKDSFFGQGPGRVRLDAAESQVYLCCLPLHPECYCSCSCEMAFAANEWQVIFRTALRLAGSDLRNGLLCCFSECNLSTSMEPQCIITVPRNSLASFLLEEKGAHLDSGSSQYPVHLTTYV